MAQKMGDMWTIPLCRKCHMRWHSSLTYRQLGHRTVEDSDNLMAREQLRLMAHWILMLDPDSTVF